MRASPLPVVLALAALAAASALDLDLAGRRLSRPYDVAHVPSGAAARVAALGHRTFASDLYWLATVQYVGDDRADERGYGKLPALADLVTDLDPRHGYAYQTAGIVLSAAGLVDESNRILAKGMERGPDWWFFPYYVSFNHWFYGGDFAEGARWARIAASKPAASDNARQLAVSLSAKSGTPADALALLLDMKATVRDEASAARLDEQIKLATLERDAQALERAAAEFRAREGRPIGDLRELVAAGLVARIPPDPFQGRYVWDPSEERVHSSRNPFRFRAPAAERHVPEFHYQRLPRESR